MITEKEKKQLRPYNGGRLKGRYIVLPRHTLTWDLSPVTVLAYGLLLNRALLSAKSGWKDEDGKLYFHYSLAALSRDLGVSETTGKGVLAELESNGLLRRVLARGKPARFYLMVLPGEDGLPGGNSPAPEARPQPPDMGDLDALLASCRARYGTAEDRGG